jgi:hypothetical protein
VKNKILPWEHWKQRVDWDQVKAAILQVEDGQLELNSVDFEMASGMIYDAAAHWIPLDMAGLNIVGLEKFGVYGAFDTKYVIDILATTKADGIKPYCDYPDGTPIVIDWKSAAGNLDQYWRKRYLRSWQGRIYSAATNAPLVEYRGVSQLQDPENPIQGAHQTKSLIVEMPASNKEQVDIHVEGLNRIAEALLPLEIYPQNAPKACKEGDREWECPFLGDCQTFTMPRKRLEVVQLSHSRMQHIFECPEKYRRMKLGDGDGGNSYSILGTAFHRGIANLYSQISGIPIEERK